MRGVFADTVALLALWNRDDQWHEPASQVFHDLKEAEQALWTTTFVILECGNAAARSPFRHDAVLMREQFANAGTLIRPTEEDCDQAWLSYQSGLAGEASIVDHVSFEVMRRLELTRAFTNDKHFRAAGFETLF